MKVNLPRSIRHNRIGIVVFAYASGNAVNVDFGDDDGLVYCDCGCLEPYTEPTEETEAEEAKTKGGIPSLSELDRIKAKEFIESHPFDVESLKRGRKVFEDMYWATYTADHAKEIALKVANKFNNPEQAAEYAVSVAKAVVEGLKRK